MASGTLFAIVKTSFGDTGCGGNTSSPLIRLVVRKANNTWVGPVTFGTVADEHTRPVLLLDTSNRKIYVFATSPTACGAIYMKTASMDNPTAGFSPVGRGTPFIKSNTYTCINNATTTKQTVDSSTGLAVLASDEKQLWYLHNYIDLGSSSYPRLVFSTNPRLGQPNLPFATQPVVTIQSAPNQTNTSFNGPVTLSLKNGTGASGATFSGSMTVNAVNGVATFSGLALSKAGIGYRLTASAGLATTPDSALFDVAKSDQTISFSAPTSKQYGDPAFTVSATAASGLPVSFSAAGSCTIAGASVTLISAGSCAITASQSGDTAYNAAPSVTQTFTVLKSQQSIDFEPLPAKRYGDPSFTISATASSGLPVSFRASGTCVVVGNEVTITGAAACTIRASQAGNANFNPAAEVAQPVKAQQTALRSIFVPIVAR